jgi:hypothetical protein
MLETDSPCISPNQPTVHPIGTDKGVVPFAMVDLLESNRFDKAHEVS